MALKTYTKEQLAAILTAHSLWLKNGRTGEGRADLSGSNLSGSDLSWSNLSGSDLSWSNLSGSDLSRSDLSWSNLSGSNLRWSNLSGSNLSGSDLSWSNLSRSNLRWSNLSGSDLSGSDLVFMHFHKWNVYAQSARLVIGCHDHPWEDWKKHGKAYAKANGCLKEFTEFWPVLEATRKVLVKRFQTKRKEGKP